MIPTMILFGLILGRWWRVALIAAAVAWPALLLAGGTISSVAEVVRAAALGFANAAAGVLVHQSVLQAVRRWG